MTEKQKILICGDVEGKFDAVFKRVENINKKSGPFDLLLCVGNFFGINNKEFTPYKLGDKKVPIPTYILGPNKTEHVSLYPENESEFEICNNVYYLGKRGIYTDSKGLKIAYISGVSGTGDKEPWTYDEKDISDLCDACFKGNPVFRGVDIFLTSQWPKNIIHDDKVKLSIDASSDLPSYICLKLKPRYVVGGLEGVYYERPPFRCPNLGDHDTTMESVTRFIGLARVGNVEKQKWIYALSLTPMDKMKVSDLLQKTTDETACPFSFAELESRIFKCKRKHTEQNQYFYDMNASEDDPKRRKKSKKQHVEFDQSKCWFCLASPSVEKHLIVSVGTHAYLALAKGGIVDEHFLICPIEHYQSSLNQPDDVLEEINEYKRAVRKFYERNNKVAVFFERNYKTSHMQLQAIPISKRKINDVKECFVEESELRGLKFEVLEEQNRLNQVIPPKTPYFMVELPDETIMYSVIQDSKNFPLNFGREVLANKKILNKVDRVDWKDCLTSKEEEEDLVKNIRTDFEPFDFTL